MRAMKQRILGDPGTFNEAELPRPEPATRIAKGRGAQAISTVGASQDEFLTHGNVASLTHSPS